jgi:hypothetical protein
MAAIAAPIATPIPLTILPSFSNFPPASSATLALFLSHHQIVRFHFRFIKTFTGFI